jgi:hypothetical protein
MCLTASKGFAIEGYYVGISNMAKNPDLKPRFMTVGRVSRVLQNGLVELTDTREGYPNEMDPIELFVEPREEILESCVRFFYKNHAELILGKLAGRVSEYHSGSQKLQKLKAGLKNFQQRNLQLVEKVPFKIGDFLSDTAPSQPALKVLTAEKPTFVFSPGGVHTSQYNDLGLQKYGPYSKEYFTPSKPRICVICQLQKKGQVEVVVRKFLNGIPPVSYGKAGNTFEFTGLKTKFYLQDCVTEIFTATDSSVDAYNKAVTAALQSGASGKTWDLALVQIDRAFRDLSGDKNPYLVTKARFISQGVSVQEFTLEALGLPDQQIVWSLNGMALATYAKLGGSPWLLTADKPIAHELVFGIGSAMVQNSRLGHKERMIGITTVFTGDGNYFINNISAAVPSDQYLETLLNNLRRTMDQVRQSLNWQPHDTVRLIFHAFKTFKDVEAEAVKQVVAELGSYRVEFAFIHIAASHPYVLFDTAQQGVGFYQKGIYAPARGQYLQISEHVSLVCLTGPTELKQASDGLPQPIQLVLHRDSTFKDVTYLSRQIVKFGAHSWRSYLPAPMPVTVYYSQLVAQMISQLSKVSTWNSDTLFNKIGNTRWFL